MFALSSTYIPLALVAFPISILASPEAVSFATAPTITLDNATVIGFTNNSVTSYLGIPFAQPPVGDLRLRLPKPIESYNGTINATQTPAQCIQLEPPIRTDMPAEMLQDMEAYLTGSAGLMGALPQDEDCLTISVQVPAGTQAGANLPVIAFIFGGGFTIGSTAQFPGDAFIQHSIELNQPVVFAAMNYRLHEVKEAGVGNLGLQDQRAALRWIHKHISAFGGDPDKVALWGPSAGAISIALQMLTNGGDAEGLFRGTIMDAGSPVPSGDLANLQPYYDTVVENTGCRDAGDTLECLRTVSADTLLAAASTLPNLFGYPGLASPWDPHADGVFLEAPPQHLVLAGAVASVPFITGDALDEGTVFATGAWNVTTEDEFREYVHQYYFSSAPPSVLLPLFDLYPNDPAQGSPFGTGDANQLAPMYKRMAAFQGDMVFQAPRRFFLNNRASKQPTWTFISQRACVSGLGCAHGSDFGPSLDAPNELTDYIIQFAATLNPNGGNQTLVWPQYDTSMRAALEIIDGGIEIGEDTLRLEAMEGLTALSVAYPL